MKDIKPQNKVNSSHADNKQERKFPTKRDTNELITNSIKTQVYIANQS